MVSAIGMGCSRLGAFWQGRSHEDAKAAVAAAVHEGVTLFDTADVYGRGLSERILGVGLRRHRDEVTLVTKCGLVKTPMAVLRVAARGDPTSEGQPFERMRGRMAGMLEAARTGRW